MIPERLKKGDTIRVIAPSSSLSRVSPENFEIAKERFEKLGLKVTISNNAYNIDEYNSSSIDDRVKDLNDAFEDKDVKMIICALGGYNVVQILDQIDYALIKKNPKIIIGFSDNTALLNAIYKKTGLITYLGPNFADFAMKLGFDYTLDYFIQATFNNKNIELFDSKEYSDDKWYANQDNRIFLPNSGRKMVHKGQANGIIIGGNLCTLQLLQGTEFMPSLEKAILFLEDDDLVKTSFVFEFDRNLHSLMLQPDFNKIQAIVIGRMQLAAELSTNDLEKLLKSKREFENIPLIINMDFGHTKPLFTIPIGAECVIEDDKVTFIQE